MVAAPSDSSMQYDEDSDTGRIRTYAGRAQWISSPSPELLGHIVSALTLTVIIRLLKRFGGKVLPSDW